MNIEQLVIDLSKQGVKLWVEGEQLRANAPKGVLTLETRDLLAKNKAELILLLHEKNPAPDTDLPLIKTERPQNLPLSFAQERLWLLNQLEPDSAFYNEQTALKLHGQLNVVALEQSLNKIIERHEALRTNFHTINEQPVQVIADSLTLNVPVVDLTELPESEREIACQQLATTEAAQPFDLASSPLIRACVVKLKELEYALVLTVHHILVDGWSTGVLMRELATIYSALCNNLSPELPELPIQYADFAIWQRQWLQKEVLQTQLDYWKQLLKNAPTLLELPTDRPRPAIQNYRGAVQYIELSNELKLAIANFSRQEGATLFMTLFSAYVTLLYRYTGSDDIVVGTPIANRDRTELEGLIGFFVNTLVLRTDLSGNPSFQQLLSRVRQVTLLSYAHPDLPFEELVKALQPQRDLSYTPLFQVLFVLQNAPMSEIELTGLTISPLPTQSTVAKFDLTLSLQNTATGLVGMWQYNADLFDAATIERMSGHFQTLLEGIVANPQERISQLPLLTELEQQQLLVDWNDTQSDYSQDKCIHQLFEEQVKRTPDAVAVVFEDQQLTYQQLNSRANQLAHYLKSLGVEADVLVGICVERSLEMVVGLLGILKAGGAYLPLDPEYPTERLSFMLEDAQVGVLLTQQGLIDKLPQHQAKQIFLDEAWSQIAQNDRDNPTSEVKAFHLANLIYTSGSTGKPKGVMVEHKGLCNLAQAQIQTFGLTSDSRILQFASFSFDASISEILMALGSGATLYLGTKDSLLPGKPLIERLRDYSITHITLPPSALAVMPVEELPALQTIIVAGEACPAELIKQWSIGRNFFNAYGPTEATVCATIAKCTEDDKKISIGKAIANTQIYILDSYLQPVPVGVPGELHIGGVGLARGYLNRPELTNEKFIPNPFSNEPHSRLYKTGDLARYLSDGSIEFLGRIDHQVKIRGYRIEIGEVENVLSQEAGVQEAVVVAREDQPGNKRLVAYVVPQQKNLDSSPITENLSIDKVELWPSVAEYYVYDELLYYAMTNDHRRNDSYKVAINQLVKDKIVVEIGTGKDAILSRFCVEGGAKKIYAIERDEETCRKAIACIEELGLADKITIIHGDATKVELPELADVCVSEIVGAIGGSEGATVIINNARRFLKPDGLMIPERSVTKMAAVTLPDQILHNPHFAETPAHYTNEIFKQVGYPFDLRVCIKKFTQANVLSTVDVLEDLNFNEYISPELSHPVKFEIQKNGQMDGFLVWLNLHTVAGEEIDILEHEHCWLPVYFPVFEPGIEVEEGDIIQAVCSRKLCENNLNPDYAIKGCLLKKNGENIEFKYISYHYKNSFRQRPFYQRLFADYDNTKYNKPNNLIQSLRANLKELLPDYMIPSSFVLLEKLPLTPNGKVDRRALPAPDLQSEQKDKYVAPRTPIEEMLALLWAQVLKLERVGIHDNFFELGGHSLLATQLFSRIRNIFKVELPLRELFARATIAELAQSIGQLQQQVLRLRSVQDLKLSTPPILPRAENAQLPLSYAQQRLWFLDQLQPLGGLYNIPLTLRLVGTLNVAALEQSLIEIIHRHEVLRTNFITVDGKPSQVIQAQTNWTLSIIDWQNLPTLALSEVEVSEKEIAIQQLVQKQAIQGFNLANEPLVRATLVVLSETEHALLVYIHHIVSDGWSMGVFIKELAALYNAYSQGQPSPLAPLPIQYADFAIWQRQWLQGDVLQSQLSYWQQQLADAPTLLSLPTDRPRGAVQTYHGAYQAIALSKELSIALKQLSQKESVTLFMTLLTAFQILLWRYSGQDDICIGTPIANRNRAEIEGLIGFFINTLVLRTRLDGNPSFRQLLSRVREVALSAYAHQDLPFEMLVEALQPERNLSHNPIFQVWFNLQNLADTQLELFGLSVEPILMSEAASKFDLSLYVAEHEQGITLQLLYNADLFTSERMVEMVQQFHHLLNQIVVDADSAIASYSLVTPQAQLLLPDPTTAIPEPEYELVTTTFTSWVNSNPELSAVRQGSRSWNYGELGKSSQALARAILSHGIERGDVVAVYGTSSFGLIASAIAVLLSGGVLLTLDPQLPSDTSGGLRQRQQLMLQEAKARYILYVDSQHPKDQEIWQSLTIICVNPDTAEAINSLESSHTIPLPEISADDAAYIFFTSGTTGVPKGVLGCHKGMAHFLNWQRQTFGIGQQDRIAQLTGLSFDVVLRDIFLPLTSGATLCLPAQGDKLEPTKILRYLEREQISVLHTVPSLAQSWLANVPSESLRNLRWLFLAGEPLKETFVLQWRDAFPQAGEIVNLYGPTETTLAKCYYQVPSEPTVGVQPVGWPLPETQALVLGTNQQLCGIGEPGEIVLRTPFCSLGYINAPEEKRSRFVKNHFRNDDQDLLYYTGDRGRYLPDGSLEILGRLDHQVKIRGIRIELGEIETVLAQHPSVHQTVVTVDEDDFGEQRLVAYIILNQESAPTISEIRRFLSTKLPQYIVPSSFVFLDSLPLTPNGKIDRRALPTPSNIINLDIFVEPRNQLEMQLVQIWSKILKVDKVGVQDNFFDLGGHSLLAPYLMAQIKQQFGKDVSLTSLFQNPTIEQLATIIQIDSDYSNSSCLIPIQPNGSKLPFFCIPGAGGEPFYLYHLGRYLGTDQPLYSFQVNNLDGELEPATRIKDMASHYIQAMQAVQPRGPYFLGGHSLGSIVAFEMATQLLHQGHIVALLVMIDMSAPTSKDKQARLERIDWNHARWLIELIKAVEVSLSTNIDISYDTLQSLPEKEQLKHVLQHLKMVNMLPPNAEITQMKNMVQALKANSLSLINYVPEQIYPGRITLLRASKTPPERLASKFSEISQDSTWGWSEYSCESVDIHFVPGNHITMMAEPHVQVLAERLKVCIEQAQANMALLNTSMN